MTVSKKNKVTLSIRVTRRLKAGAYVLRMNIATGRRHATVRRTIQLA